MSRIRLRKVSIYIYIYIYSHAWNVALYYVKVLHYPIHPRAGGWTGPPVGVNMTIIPATYWWKTEIWFCKHSLIIITYATKFYTSALPYFPFSQINLFTAPRSKQFLVILHSAFHPVSKLWWIPTVVCCTVESTRFVFLWVFGYVILRGRLKSRNSAVR
jgi:hypothetical protein